MFVPTRGGDLSNLPHRSERVLFAGYYFNHYGHFITESLARLWALDQCGNVDKIIFVMGGVVPGQLRDGVIKTIIPENAPEIEIVEQACSFDEIIVPQSGFVIRKSFNENYWKWLRKLSADIMESDQHNSIDTPLYLSRSATPETRRYAYGEKELEAGLKKAGIRVVQPEKLSFSDQVKIVSEHKTVIGLEGSQLHSLLFTMGKKKSIQLDFRKVNPNYLLIDDMLGNEKHYPLLQLPEQYQKFILGRDNDEPYIFDPQKAAEAIGSALGIKIVAPELTQDTKKAFAASWINWWTRSAYNALTKSPMAKPLSAWGSPPRIWGLTGEQHRSNVACLLAAI
ncbi:glycosyltransferase family 61 protein [Paracoccus aestuariivivens]|uniref:DUF563 domain-containing protein n=1 Tax=Paracoccus aestuariivivens TaxID=1820333 RepID=A0A6L6JFZ0_9RHOB|nr:glycosyltransferase family 61 protein [Paracoccus aestuariivivens]MTH80108.1 DUF563 domain-containing protein [Paracoccus aestuariivivens]